MAILLQIVVNHLLPPLQQAALQIAQYQLLKQYGRLLPHLMFLILLALEQERLYLHYQKRMVKLVQHFKIFQLHHRKLMTQYRLVKVEPAQRHLPRALY